MPWYRINGMPVHIRGNKLPPACAAFMVSEDGVTLQRCMDIAPLLCDGPGTRRDTCDKPMCAAHAWEVGADRHLCPLHLFAQVDGQAQRALFSSLVRP